jgi:D-glycero-alpha-D-manno-heptose-7-phosphate kinase
MIISRTPVRISFFGGGTDYPAWYCNHGGAVLSTTIDKYSYISCRYLPPFFEHRSRIVYSTIELVTDHSQIRHPAVREALRYLGVDQGLEVHYDGDLPARTGVGSSSSFTVGLLHALYALKNQRPSKMQLARDAIHVEQALIGEHVGAQDQTAAAFGGFNRIDFHPDGVIDVQPVILPPPRLAEFWSHLLLVFTGFARNASEIAAKQVKAMPAKSSELFTIRQMVDAALDTLCSDADLAEFGKLMHEGWLLKRSLTKEISNPAIDRIYETARAAGALGGKLLGAGGGGFVLLFVRPEQRRRVLDRLQGLMHVPFRMERTGSQIVVYQPDDPTDHAPVDESGVDGQVVRAAGAIVAEDAGPFPATGARFPVGPKVSDH